MPEELKLDSDNTKRTGQERFVVVLCGITASKKLKGVKHFLTTPSQSDEFKFAKNNLDPVESKELPKTV